MPDKERTLKEVREAMKGSSLEELVRWLRHVENNPYKVDNMSDKIIQVLKTEIASRRKTNG